MHYNEWAFHDIEPIYLQLIKKIECAILSTQLSAGEELPSIRAIAKLLKISPNTVMKAYMRLCQSGLIISSRNGHYSVIDNEQYILQAKNEKVRQRGPFPFNTGGGTMSATAAIAKTAVTVVSDKRGQTAIGVLICSVIMLFFLPLIVFMGVMGNMDDIQIDTAQAQQMVVQNLSAEDKATLTHLETVMNTIQTEFEKRKLNNYTVKKAQALYACALFDAEKTDPDFISKYADCFENAQTDDELRTAIFSAFGVSIDADEFNNLMSVIKNTVIDISGLSTEKNNLNLVKWAEYAYENKWGYVYGSHCDVLTESELNRLKSVFGSYVTEKEDYIRSHWLGRRTVDCVGLIKGYGWYDSASGTIQYGTNGMKDVTADGMYAAATEKGTINTMPDIPGLAVWHEGHIGVYIGNGYVIHAANTYDGVIKTPITSSGWTHWLKIPYINYVENEE